MVSNNDEILVDYILKFNWLNWWWPLALAMSRMLREQCIPCTWNIFLNFRDAIRVRLKFKSNKIEHLSWSGMLWISCQFWSQKTFDSFHSTYNTHLKRILGLRFRKSSYYSLCLYKAFSFTGSFTTFIFYFHSSTHHLTITFKFPLFNFFYLEFFTSVHK